MNNDLMDKKYVTDDPEVFQLTNTTEESTEDCIQ